MMLESFLSLNELYIKAKTGDSAAQERLFSNLLDRFRVISYRILLNREDADDAANEAAMSIFNGLSKLEIHTSFVGYALTACRRTAYKYVMLRKKEVTSVTDDMGMDCRYEISPLMEDRLLNCLKKISSKNRKYARILNFIYQGYGFNEICHKMNIEKNHAYLLLSRARKALRACITEEEGKS